MACSLLDSWLITSFSPWSIWYVLSQTPRQQFSMLWPSRVHLEYSESVFGSRTSLFQSLFFRQIALLCTTPLLTYNLPLFKVESTSWFTLSFLPCISFAVRFLCIKFSPYAPNRLMGIMKITRSQWSSPRAWFLWVTFHDPHKEIENKISPIRRCPDDWDSVVLLSSAFSQSSENVTCCTEDRISNSTSPFTSI